MIQWHTFPMGGAAAERAELRGRKAWQSHAVDMATNDPLCAKVETHSLCFDASLCPAGEMPDCPVCNRKIRRLTVLGKAKEV